MRNKYIRWGLVFLAFFLVSTGVYLSSVVIGAAAIDEKKLIMSETTEIYDTNGQKFADLYIEDREMIDIEEVPDHVKQAFIAIEDIRFYDHQGIDPRAILRALYRDIAAGAKVEGGSTITQQLAKNAFLTSDKTILRKTKEVLIAMGLERKFSKDEILGLYLNQIYFGHGAYGIQSAAELYFGKEVNDLTVDEAALLAGIPKAPSHYSPVEDPERSVSRRNTVLAIMERHGFLTAEETITYQGKTVPDTIRQPEENKAYFTYIDMVLEEAETKYNISSEQIYKGGYEITVPVNIEMQKASYELFQDNTLFPEGSEDTEAAFVMMNHKNGGVLAVQGGREYVRRGLNRVTVKRQPGSVLKPLAVYAPALETGKYDPYSLLKDEKMDFDGYSPRNYNDQYQGEITMSEAITDSTNTAAVWLYDQIGREISEKWMERAGLQIEDNGLAVALGGLSNGVSPIELSTAYTAFSNQGKRVSPYFIESITNRNGETVGEAEKQTTEVMSSQNAWYMTRMLENVVKEGTGTKGNTHYPLAGKTGTTSFIDVEGATRDAWFVGFTPQWTGALWMGYDKTTEDRYLQAGSSYPTQLFKEILNQTPQPENSQVAFQKPENVKDLESPIEMSPVNDLTASLSFKGAGLLNIQLNWTPSNDSRVKYYVYEVENGKSNKIGEIEGTGQYVIEGANIFSLKDYLIVPYNPQTNREGEPSNVADVSVGSLFGAGNS
ncbi:transglycosylase domain-containing protein [Alteribacillus iranensis]|uniref:Penicillin-binding protein 2A n=1 Tax=Alteribacillus iranensis TaxID=930128 RepID=A0A1I1Z5E9_9BACI|nr:PBP1A family penicillin-binding protein [Alteribacillus iranensis]SFE26782.1 penicillin-binding protein 2A [Alteribacillus iranensis]